MIYNNQTTYSLYIYNQTTPINHKEFNYPWSTVLLVTIVVSSFKINNLIMKNIIIYIKNIKTKLIQLNMNLMYYRCLKKYNLKID